MAHRFEKGNSENIVSYEYFQILIESIVTKRLKLNRYKYRVIHEF